MKSELLDIHVDYFLRYRAEKAIMEAKHVQKDVTELVLNRDPTRHINLVSTCI